MELVALLKSYDELEIIRMGAKGMICSGIVFAVLLQFMKGEYGRYFNSCSSPNRWGFGIDARLAWFVQELPSFCVPCLLLCDARPDVLGLSPNAALLSLLLLHYTQR